MIADVSLFNILVPVVIVVAIAGRGFGVDGRYMASWADWFNVQLTNETDPIVRRYLVWTRRCRTAGGVTGFLAPTLFFAVTSRQQPDDIGGWAVSMMLVGYLIGAVVAEIALDPVRNRPTLRAAVPTRLGDVLPSYAITSQRGLAIASLVLAGVYALSKSHAHVSGLPDVAQVAAWGVAAVCTATVVEALQRRILARSRRHVTEVAAIDEAIRASSVLVLAGAAIALLLNIAGAMFMLSTVSIGSDGGLPAWLAFGAFVLLFLTAIHFWLHFGKPGGFGNRQVERQGATT